MAFNGEDFTKLNIDFSKFDKIIFDRLPQILPTAKGIKLTCLIWFSNSKKNQPCPQN